MCKDSEDKELGQAKTSRRNGSDLSNTHTSRDSKNSEKALELFTYLWMQN